MKPLLCVIAAALLLPPTLAPAQQTVWTGSWAASPVAVPC